MQRIHRQTDRQTEKEGESSLVLERKRARKLSAWKTILFRRDIVVELRRVSSRETKGAVGNSVSISLVIFHFVSRANARLSFRRFLERLRRIPVRETERERKGERQFLLISVADELKFWNGNFIFTLTHEVALHTVKNKFSFPENSWNLTFPLSSADSSFEGSASGRKAKNVNF